MQLWGEPGGVDATFPDIEALAAECRFRDCSHQTEPGCRVQAALASGELDEARYHSWLALGHELAWLERRVSARATAEERKKWKQIAQFSREVKKRREGF